MRYFWIVLTLICVLISCKKKEEEMCDVPVPPVTEANNPNLKYFGFTLVDVFFDDPNDTETKTNYCDEVYSFSNIADILIYDPAQDIGDNIDTVLSYDMKAVLHVSEIFFEQTGTGGSMSGVIYGLRSDFAARWDAFQALNPEVADVNETQCLYLGEEPTWNSISFADLKAASDYLEVTCPDVPIMVIEAYPVLDDLELPTSVDWYGFDHYFIPHPETSTVFATDLATIRSKKSASHQQIMLVMDAHYIPWAHGNFGIQEADMTGIAQEYHNLALENNDVVGILGYHWPSGFEYTDAKGARELSQTTRDKYIEIGKSITGK